MNQVIKKRKSTDLNVRQIPGSEVNFFFSVFPCQIYMGLHEICSYELLTERKVGMAGYWPASIFAFKNAEKERG